MSEDELIVDGTRVRFVRLDDGSLGVYRLAPTESGSIREGSLELLEDGTGFVARRLDGRALTRPSPWGGDVTAHFSSRDLAVRALRRCGEISD